MMMIRQSHDSLILMIAIPTPVKLVFYIGFNMVPWDPFMSHQDTQIGYSTGEFQALQLIVLAAFGVVDQPLASCMFVRFLEIRF